MRINLLRQLDAAQVQTTSSVNLTSFPSPIPLGSAVFGHFPAHLHPAHRKVTSELGPVPWSLHTRPAKQLSANEISFPSRLLLLRRPVILCDRVDESPPLLQQLVILNTASSRRLHSLERNNFTIAISNT